MEWTAKGSIRIREDGEITVDLWGELTGLEVVGAPRGGVKRVSSVPALSEEDVQGEIDAARAALGAVLARLADDMVDLMARENKRGRVSLSRALREVYRPLVPAREKLGADALVFGLEQAVAKGIPNANYAKKAAESFRQQPPQPPSGGRYDRLGE